MIEQQSRGWPSFRALNDGHSRVGPWAVAAGAIGAVSVIGAIDPNEAGHYPTCPWLSLTGTYCPGCGSLRAIHALAHGDVETALMRNPLAVLTAGWLLVWFFAWSVRTTTGRTRSSMAPPWVLYAILGVVIAYWVLRNVPGWTFLSPA